MSNGTGTDFFNDLGKQEVASQGLTIETLRGILAELEASKRIASATLSNMEDLVRYAQIVSDHLRASSDRLANEVPAGLTRQVRAEPAGVNAKAQEVVPQTKGGATADMGQALGGATDARGGL